MSTFWKVVFQSYFDVYISYMINHDILWIYHIPISKNMIETSELQPSIYWLQCEISASAKPIRVSLPLVLCASTHKPLQGSLSLLSQERFASIQQHNLWEVLPRVLSLSKVFKVFMFSILELASCFCILCWASLNPHSPQWALGRAQHLPGKSPSWICTHQAAY